MKACMMIYMCRKIHYYYHMHSKTSATNASRYMNLILLNFSQHHDCHGSISEEYRSRTEIVDGCRNAANGKENQWRLTVPHQYISTWKIMTQIKNLLIWCIGRWATSIDRHCLKNWLWMVSNREKTGLDLRETHL